MNKTFALIALGCALPLFVSAPAMAAPPKQIGKYGYWSAYEMVEGQNTVCYMSITAKPPEKKDDKKKKAAKRGDVVLMITHRPSEGSTDVISYAAGAKFKSASDVVFKIGGKDYSLFTQGDTAWSRDQATDRAVADALRKSANMTVTGTLASGAPLSDSVNLKGVNDAYAAISKACNVAYTPIKSDKPKAEKPKIEKPTVSKPKPPVVKKP